MNAQYELPIVKMLDYNVDIFNFIILLNLNVLIWDDSIVRYLHYTKD